jgi:hypothetical protein
MPADPESEICSQKEHTTALTQWELELQICDFTVQQWRTGDANLRF